MVIDTRQPQDTPYKSAFEFILLVSCSSVQLNCRALNINITLLSAELTAKSGHASWPKKKSAQHSPSLYNSIAATTAETLSTTIALALTKLGEDPVGLAEGEAEVLDAVLELVLEGVLDDELDDTKAASTGDPPTLFPLAVSYG